MIVMWTMWWLDISCLWGPLLLPSVPTVVYTLARTIVIVQYVILLSNSNYYTVYLQIAVYFKLEASSCVVLYLLLNIIEILNIIAMYNSIINKKLSLIYTNHTIFATPALRILQNFTRRTPHSISSL